MTHTPFGQRLLSFLLLAGAVAGAQGAVFSFQAARTNLADGTTAVVLDVRVPPQHLLYADKLAVQATPPLAPDSVPTATTKPDPFSGEPVPVFTHDIRFVYRAGAVVPSTLTVAYQGCSDTICFFPETVTVPVAGATPAATATAPADQPAPPPPEPMAPQAGRFAVVRETTGYLPPAAFLAFLDPAGGTAGTGHPPTATRGFWMTLLLIVAGGLALNLTPCVLPMIPINLAIIGAGARAGSRRRGFALGATYAVGVALVYGLLGMAVVLTGAQFGALQSSPSFNLGIAVVFLALAAASFGLFHIDFTRFQPGSAFGTRRGPFVTAFVFGGLAALLAGACVAPTLIFVLLLAADYWTAGNPYGLLMPFLLGAGMGLPWPFAGAGLSFLPKPGRWMEGVKYLFGVVILGFACYYGFIGYRTLHGRPDDDPEVLARAFAEAKKTGRPVLVDFWATWCKSCSQMESTTFKDPSVQARLKEFVVVKFKADALSKGPAAPVLQHYRVKGLPTYLILEPQ